MHILGGFYSVLIALSTFKVLFVITVLTYKKGT